MLFIYSMMEWMNSQIPTKCALITSMVVSSPGRHGNVPSHTVQIQEKMKIAQSSNHLMSKSYAQSMSSALKQELNSLNIKDLRAQFTGFNIRCGVLLIRVEDGRMLMVTEKPRGEFVGNVIGPPKGAVRKYDKSCMHTACRELFEETGICIDEQTLSQSYFIFHHPYFREMLIIFIAVVSNMPEPQPDNVEISKCEWLSIDELKNKDNMSAYTQRLINCLYTMCLSDYNSL